MNATVSGNCDRRIKNDYKYFIGFPMKTGLNFFIEIFLSFNRIHVDFPETFIYNTNMKFRIDSCQGMTSLW